MKLPFAKESDQRTQADLDGARISKACHDLGILWRPQKNSDRDLQCVCPIGAPRMGDAYTRWLFEVHASVQDAFVRSGPKFAAAMRTPPLTVMVGQDDSGLFYVEKRSGETPRVTYAHVRDLINRRANGQDWARPGTVILGKTVKDEPLVLDMESPGIVHALIVGATGCGKSTLMRTMIRSGHDNGAEVALFDPSATNKLKGMALLSGLPRVWRGGVFVGFAEIGRGLEALVSEMRRRMRLVDPPVMLIAIDEIPDVLSLAPGALDSIMQLVQRGRHANMHLTIGSQDSRVEKLSSEIVNNIATRILGRLPSAQASYFAGGRGKLNASLLGAFGDLILVAGNQDIHFQAAICDDEAALARQFPARRPRVPALQERALGSVEPSQVGRPPAVLSPQVIQAIAAYRKEHKEDPSLNAISALQEEHVGVGCNRDVARRYISAVREGA